ncbi:MAG: 5-(carboxyamino)imidazole ribonucleotide mutase [Methanobrevibacter sp.]|jgi:5-(carboxyamino)imidazole ribonucleotide mutase|nr:5-(carboxyamino)imidazole ribonucleotide mutase [Candidatus Methanovirga procula]
MVPKVLIILGSGSDLKIAKRTMDILEELQISYGLNIASAHRTHEKVKNVVIKGTEVGIKVFIGVAGLAAHLPGVIASFTHRPVIAVPVDVSLSGLDSLLAAVQTQFPASVATVGINRGDNAGILAAEILGIDDENIRTNLSKLRKSHRDKVYCSEEEILSEIRGSYFKNFELNQNIEDKYNFNSISKIDNISDVDCMDKDLNGFVDVAVILDSHLNIKVAETILEILNKLDISHDFKVTSPIANPIEFSDYINRMKDVKLFVGIGGSSAVITGSIVALSETVVIGVPCSNQLNGLDALLSMVNMPPGVPVATVGIDSGENAALLIGRILGIHDKKIETDLKGEIDNERVFKEI